MSISEMLFCSECGNMLRKFIKEEGKIFGICREGHMNPLEPSDFSKLSKLLGPRAKKGKKKET